MPDTVAPTTRRWTPLGIFVPSAAAVTVWVPVEPDRAKAAGTTIKSMPVVTSLCTVMSAVSVSETPAAVLTKSVTV